METIHTFVLSFFMLFSLVMSQSAPSNSPTTAGGGGSSNCGYNYQPMAITFIATSGLFLTTTIVGAGLLLAGVTSTSLFRAVVKPTKMSGMGINESTDTETLGGAVAGALGAMGLTAASADSKDTAGTQGTDPMPEEEKKEEGTGETKQEV